jgi:activator of 2-hydroxyglutaryl-CoA dehydratase
VFAESEVISLVAGGEPLEGILKGLHQALASRVAALARGTSGGGDLFMSGGVALNAAMVGALRDALGRPVQVLPDPQLVGAIGAALSVMPGAA